jgi:hypothetical protein
MRVPYQILIPSNSTPAVVFQDDDVLKRPPVLRAFYFNRAGWRGAGEFVKKATAILNSALTAS